MYILYKCMHKGSMMEEPELKKKKKEFCCYSHPSGNQAPHRFFISFLAFPTLLYFYYYLYLIFWIPRQKKKEEEAENSIIDSSCLDMGLEIFIHLPISTPFLPFVLWCRRHPFSFLLIIMPGVAKTQKGRSQ
jgi:hypothetical protein